VNQPAGASQTNGVNRAADKKGQRPLFERIERKTISDPDGDASEHQPRQKTEVPSRVSDGS